MLCMGTFRKGLGAGRLALAAIGLGWFPFPAVCLAADAAWAPQRSVEWLIPAAAGGGFDATARVIHKVISDRKLVPTPLIIVNKVGGGGAVAWSVLLQRAGDGEVIGTSAPNLITNELTGSSSITIDSVTPVVHLYEEYSVVTVRSDSPIKSGLDLVARLRQDPASVSIAIAPALGAGNHIAVIAALRAAGVDIRKLKVVPFPSSGASATALLGGHVDVMSASTGAAEPHVVTGKLRVIAVSAPARLEAPFADSPTWGEQGVRSSLPSWLNVVGPPKLARSQIQFWEMTFAQATSTPEWNNYLWKTRRQSRFLTSDDAKKYLQEKRELIGTVLSDLGLAKR